jgi:hypothetical protein
MAKIELSLKSNIDLITAGGLFGYKLKESDLTPLVKRISKNFYYHHIEQLALTAFGIWNEHHDRKHVHRILDIAHDMETDWRSKNQLAFVTNYCCNPDSFDPISFAILARMQAPTLNAIRFKLSALSEEDFRTTPYYKCVRSIVASHFGGECPTRINDIPCGATQDLHIHYMNRDHARGQEHIYYRTDLTVACPDCLARANLTT